MEILNLADRNFMWSMGAVLLIFCTFYFLASRRQNVALKKVDDSLKRQEQANHQLGLILTELRRSNRLLAELANIEPTDEQYAEPNNVASSSYQTGASETSTDPQFKLYVGNIDYSATEAELGAYFAQYGKVEFVNIPVNRYTGKARGFGFVTFLSKEDAERAMSLHGSEFKGRQIQVNFAKERETA